MDDANAGSLRRIDLPPDRVAFEGDLTAANADEFARRLQALDADASGVIQLDLSGLDIDDGVAIAIAVNALRQLSSRAAKLILVAAPQMLCHNLYRIGLLNGDRIELVEMREDEPAGS
ncbi:MAG: STAS domain-containing protein [Blastocatellia bacterium]